MFVMLICVSYSEIHGRHIVGLHVPLNESYFEQVLFKERAFLKLFRIVLAQFTCLKKDLVLSTLWRCVVMVLKMLPVKYLAIFTTFFNES